MRTGVSCLQFIIALVDSYEHNLNSHSVFKGSFLTTYELVEVISSFTLSEVRGWPHTGFLFEAYDVLPIYSVKRVCSLRINCIRFKAGLLITYLSSLHILGSLFLKCHQRYMTCVSWAKMSHP